MFWQRPTHLTKFQGLMSQICLFWGHLGNRLAKNGKNRINPNKCDICTLDIMVDFYWKNEANRWRSEICLIRSYADSLLILYGNFHLLSCQRIYSFSGFLFSLLNGANRKPSFRVRDQVLNWPQSGEEKRKSVHCC